MKYTTPQKSQFIPVIELLMQFNLFSQLIMDEWVCQKLQEYGLEKYVKSFEGKILFIREPKNRSILRLEWYRLL